MAKLLTLLNVILIPKGHNYEINPYLKSSEIQCKCHRKNCHYSLVNQVCTDAFYNMRFYFSKPLTITSFYRCQEHNSYVGGVKHSSHTTGNAMDISTNYFTPEEKEKLIALAVQNFDYVKVYPTFIHCQINPKVKVGGTCG